MAYKLRDKRNRNERLYQFWKSHRDWTYISIGAVFHISGVRAWDIIRGMKEKADFLTINRKGSWCLWKDNLFCQEDSGCLNCNIYYQTMPIPWDTPKEKEDVRDKG